MGCRPSTLVVDADAAAWERHAMAANKQFQQRADVDAASVRLASAAEAREHAATAAAAQVRIEAACDLFVRHQQEAGECTRAGRPRTKPPLRALFRAPPSSYYPLVRPLIPKPWPATPPPPPPPGFLHRTGLTTLLAELRLPSSSPADLDAALARLDEDRDGRVGLAEFLRHYEPLAAEGEARTLAAIHAAERKQAFAASQEAIEWRRARDAAMAAAAAAGLGLSLARAPSSSSRPAPSREIVPADADADAADGDSDSNGGGEGEGEGEGEAEGEGEGEGEEAGYPGAPSLATASLVGLSHMGRQVPGLSPALHARLLSGKAGLGELEELALRPGLRVFVSSTILDTNAERK